MAKPRIAPIDPPYPAEKLIELVMLTGLYHAVSFMINAFGVENEKSAPTFPEAS